MSMQSNAVASAGARKWLNENSTVVVTLVAVVVIATFLATMKTDCFDFESSPAGEAFYYVPETAALFVADAKLVPPIDRNGSEAVKAHFYGCGDCEGDSRFLGYYEKYSDGAKAELERINERMAADQEIDPETEERAYELAMTERFISTDGEEWVLAESSAGIAIRENLRVKCGTGKLVYCSP